MATDGSVRTVEPAKNMAWLPVIVGVLLVVATVAAAWALLQRERREIQTRVDVEARNISSYIANDSRARLTALERLAGRWESEGGTPRGIFEDDAAALISDLPGFVSISWFDGSLEARWIVQTSDAQPAAASFAMVDQLDALQTSGDLKTAVMTRALAVDDTLAFLVFLPVFVDGLNDGYLRAVLESQSWFDHILGPETGSPEDRNYRAAVGSLGTTVYEQEGWNTESRGDFASSVSSTVIGVPFTIGVRPTDSFVRQNISPTAAITTVAGVLLAVLLSSIVYLLQSASRDAWRAHSAREALEAEVAQRQETEQELRETTSRLSLAARAGGIGVWSWNTVTGELSWDTRMFEIYEVPEDARVTYDTWRERVHPDDRAASEALLQEAVAGTATFDTEFRTVRRDGSIRYVRAAAQVQRDSEGKAIHLTGVNWDVTEQKNSERMLAEQRRRLSDIVDGTNIGTWEWNIQTGETVYNERWADILGYTLDELQPISIETWNTLANPDDNEGSWVLLNDHFEGRSDYYECEVRMKHKDGRWVWILDRGKVATRTDDGKPCLMSGTHQDITERKHAEEEIRHMATHDALTGLPSLRLGRDRLAVATAGVRRNQSTVGIMFLDLDGFKSINDNYGHDAGDAVLIEVGSRVKNSLRETDTVARIGGDEFLIVAVDLTDRAAASQVAQKIIGMVAKPIPWDGEALSVGASVGIALCAEHGTDPETLLRLADQAMYTVKKSGKNGHAFAGESIARAG